MSKKLLSLALIAGLCCGSTVATEELPLFQKDDGKTFQVSSHSPNLGDAWNINPDESKVILDMKGPAFIIEGAIEWEGTEGCGPLYVSTYNNDWSNNLGANFVGKKGQSTSKTVTVPEDGKYTIGANFISSELGAIGQVKINGKKIGKPVDTDSDIPRDDYLLNVNPAMGIQILGEIKLTAGEHTAEVEIVGNNPDAKGSEIMIDCLTVTK